MKNMDNLRNKLILFSAVIFIILLAGTGCWNRAEINERSLIIGVAFDRPKQSEKEATDGDGKENTSLKDNEFKKPSPPPKDEIPKYTMSIEIPVVKNIQGGGGAGGGGGGGGGGGAQGTNHWILSSTGNSVWDIERIYGERSGRLDFFGHLKVIVISEEVARDGITEILDFFTRKKDIHGRTKVLIANGEAKKVLEVIPFEENWAALYVEKLLTEKTRTATKVEGDFITVLRSLATSGNVLLPRVRASSNNEVVTGGAAVIKDGKMVGWLGELEASGANIILNRVSGGSITIVDPHTGKGLISVASSYVSTERDVEIKGGRPIFKIKVFFQGEIIEKENSYFVWNDFLLNQIERRVELEIQRRALAVVTKLQRQFKADIFEFGEMVAKKYPSYWKKAGKNWDEEFFPKTELLVEVDAKVRRTGATR